MGKRLDSEHPVRDLDKIDYEKNELDKQLDLQTIKITITRSDNDLRWRRTSTRQDNEEGQFKRLLLELN